MNRALVVGAGPAGLMAAETMAEAGLSVTVVDQMPSPARKFLMAGKSGLNLTMDEPFERFVTAYREPALRPMLEAFGPEDVRRWAVGLDVELFTGSSGRVFPKSMKASPLLRAWLQRLGNLGVELKTRWRWQGGSVFDTPNGRLVLEPDVFVLALGGASWARLGSDGAWTRHFDSAAFAPFAPANMGFVVNWTEHMQPHFGAPVKNVVLTAGGVKYRGEFVVSSRGVEGTAVYAVSRALRDGASLVLDLAPDIALKDLETRLAKAGKQSLPNALKRLGLEPVKRALFFEFGKNRKFSVARTLKALPLTFAGPRPLDEAISVAGGIRFDFLDAGLMIKSSEGTFVCGEMLDWEAPTGGYLLTACLSTGRWAGLHAARSVAG